LLHAPRQTDKTTCLLVLADYLNQAGRYRAVYANIEGAQAYRPTVLVLHDTLKKTLAAGLAQTWDYADRCAADEAHLIIFDRTTAKPWGKKIWRREASHQGMAITVWGA